jgi:hypothetical protein
MQDIDVRLQAMNTSIQEYGQDAVQAMQFPPSSTHPEDEPFDASFHSKNVVLNAQQQAVFDLVCKYLQQRPAQFRLIHLEAAAGSGKTFLCKCLTMTLRAVPGKSVRCTAFTAKAASNYPGGHTAHYEFQLNVGNVFDRPPTTRLLNSTGLQCAGIYPQHFCSSPFFL